MWDTNFFLCWTYSHLSVNMPVPQTFLTIIFHHIYLLRFLTIRPGHLPLTMRLWTYLCWAICLSTQSGWTRWTAQSLAHWEDFPLTSFSGAQGRLHIAALNFWFTVTYQPSLSRNQVWTSPFSASWSLNYHIGYRCELRKKHPCNNSCMRHGISLVQFT